MDHIIFHIGMHIHIHVLLHSATRILCMSFSNFKFHGHFVETSII